jgi:hypothetical protein
MTATIDGLAAWADERGLACRALGFGRGLLISETVSVRFRGASPFVVVDWGDDCRADFARGLPLGLLTYFIAGLLPSAEAAARTVTYDLSDSARRHALIAALDRYADKQQTMAAAGIDSDRNLTLAAHAKEMQQQAAEAATR